MSGLIILFWFVDEGEVLRYFVRHSPHFLCNLRWFFLSLRAGAFHGRDVMYVRPMGRDRWVYIFITDKVHTSWYCHKQMIPSHVRSTLPMRPPLQISVDAAHPKVRIFLIIAYNSRLSHHLHSLGRHLANHRVLLLCGGNHSRYRCLQGAYYFATRLH